MPMNNIDLLSDEDLSDERQAVEEGEEGHIPLENRELINIINFHSIGHDSHSAPSSLVLICDEADLMAPFNEALGQLIPVGFHSTELGQGEVSANHYTIFLVGLVGLVQ